MHKRRLHAEEKDAISSILDEAESELFSGDTNTSPSLRSLDDQCRILFPDWDRALNSLKSARNEVSRIDFDTAKPKSDSDSDLHEFLVTDASSRPSICDEEIDTREDPTNSGSQDSNPMSKIAPSPSKIRRVDKQIEDLKHERASIKKDIAKVKRAINESQSQIEQLKAKFRRSEKIRVKMTKTLGVS